MINWCLLDNLVSLCIQPRHGNGIYAGLSLALFHTSLATASCNQLKGVNPDGFISSMYAGWESVTQLLLLVHF